MWEKYAAMVVLFDFLKLMLGQIIMPHFDDQPSCILNTGCCIRRFYFHLMQNDAFSISPCKSDLSLADMFYFLRVSNVRYINYSYTKSYGLLYSMGYSIQLFLYNILG